MTLKDLIEDAGFETRSYSGRYMYGKECLGAILDQGQSEIAFAVDVMETAIQSIDDYDSNEIVYGIQEISSLLKKSIVDSLGMGKIIYFPEVEYK